MEPPVTKSDEATRAAPHYKWSVVAMLWAISFFNYADRQAVFSVFPLLEAEMGLTDTEKGLLGSSFAWVYGLCAPFAGMVVDRVRRKRAILGGLHAWSLICLATGLSRRFWHLFAFRAAEGLGETFYYPAATSMLSDYHGPATRSRALGLHQTSVYVGTIAGGYLAGLLGDYLGWRWSFYVFGACGVLLGLVLARFLHEPPRGATEATRAAQRLPTRDVIRLIATTPTLIALMLGFVCANFVAVVALTWMPTYLHRRFDLSLAEAGWTATAYIQLASLAGAILGGWLADLIRRRTTGGRILVQVLGVLGAAPFVYFTGQMESLNWLVAMLAAWGLFKGLYDANIFAAAFDVVPPEARGTVAGVMNMVGWLGGGSASVVIAWIKAYQGLGWAISSAALVYLAAALFLLLAGAVFIRRDLGQVNEPT
jgi:MFS family permease